MRQYGRNLEQFIAIMKLAMKGKKCLWKTPEYDIEITPKQRKYSLVIDETTAISEEQLKHVQSYNSERNR